MAAGKPDSFLHVSRPEIDVPGARPGDPATYAAARAAFERLIREGKLIRDEQPRLYLYRLTRNGRAQLGIVAEVLVQAYLDGRVRRHEFTRPDKEDDRTRHVEAINANSGPVFLIYRDRSALHGLLHDWVDAHAPDVDFVADDGVRHELWVIDDSDVIREVVDEIEAGGALYIADGHHRCAAAARVCQTRRNQGANSADAPWEAFLGVAFPDSELEILDYNRVVRDLNGLDESEFLERIRESFAVEPADEPVHPSNHGEFGMYLGGKWYRLRYLGKIPTDPVGHLDVSILATELLDPVLGIKDARRDERINFVGGIRGLSELERLVDSGEYAVAFAMRPTDIDELLAVADAGEVMPPKSTWFEPKLRDGMVIQQLED